ncbi:MAG: hypothetical protein ACFFDI_03935, partial [Promethearchaeota archaeon]
MAITIAGIVISALVFGFISWWVYYTASLHSVKASYLTLEVVDCTEVEGFYLNITQRDLTDYPALKTAIDEILQTNKTSVSIRIQDEELERTESEFIHGYP